MGANVFVDQDFTIATYFLHDNTLMFKGRVATIFCEFWFWSELSYSATETIYTNIIAVPLYAAAPSPKNFTKNRPTV